MLAFLDFEASSLGKKSVPIEVAWVWEDGRGESHLIRPADGWDDWNERAEAIHHVSRATLRFSHRNSGTAEISAAMFQRSADGAGG